VFDQTIERRSVASMAALPEDDVARRFAYHPPRRAGVADLHEHVRDECAGLAQELNRVLPGCPEAWKALDAVDLACMHANAAIARHYNDSGLPVPIVDADPTTGKVARFLATEQQDGETVGDVWARLIDELRGRRQQAAEQMAAENWQPPTVEGEAR
jgi:hypothetical protein